MQDEAKPLIDPSDVAERLAKQLNERGCEYALGGALALAYWAQPRGTMDVDLTLFLPIEKPSEAVWLLGEIGCEVHSSEAISSIQQHGFCVARYGSCRVDAFLPSMPFYSVAKARRQKKPLGEQEVMIWDAETLAVFKMMFFRAQDVVDVQQLMKYRGSAFDRSWVRKQLVEMYGTRDPRITRWDELADEGKP